MIIRSRAPLRISFGGGGTDISPYPEKKGGLAINAAINKYAYASLIPRPDDRVTITSYDYNQKVEGELPDLPYDGRLDLAKAAIRLLEPPQGFDLLLHTDVPPESGLGSSSAITVAVLGALARWLGRALAPGELAELAYITERIELGIRGGWQDQYAAVYGGFNWMEFNREKTRITPLSLPEETLLDLSYHLVLCYTGLTRKSAVIMNDMKSTGDSLLALESIKELACLMKAALLEKQLERFGTLLTQSWEQKKRLSPNITNPVIDRLYRVARDNGAIGGKLLGAGGGGYLVFYCLGPKVMETSKALALNGGHPEQVSFSAAGLKTWEGN